jgi:NADH-quinone oxidoreductase subunit C
MKPNEIFTKLKVHFGEEILELIENPPSDSYILVKAQKIDEICQFLRDDDALHFDYLTLLSGLDLKENLGIVYHLFSMKHKHRLVVKTQVSKENPTLPTIERIWRTGDWHEREAYDMFGVIFNGHHNLIRILCPYDWEGYPLRKDYKEPEEYHGNKVPY